MASALQPTISKSGKPVTEKKKRKRPSKKVPTTVLESSSTNFMDLVQKLTGSAAELSSSPSPPTKAPTEDNGQPKSPATSPQLPASEPTSSTPFFQNYLHNAIYNDDSSSSSQPENPLASAALQFPQFLASLDPTVGFNFSAEALDDEDDDYYESGCTSGASSRAIENDTSLFSSSWREPNGHSEYWYHQMDAMRA